jgi:hypothetical protein
MIDSQLTVSKESITSAKCRSGEILLGWHAMGERSGGSLGYSGNLGKTISYCIIICVRIQGIYVLKGNLLQKQL